jgi:hypothetical protein|tara:strand:- start:4675 stop:4902 length:228 start_codon:yes stop_codon:yes gene_type:complete
MEDKIAKEIAVQLKRIADALDKSNNQNAVAEKRKLVIDKLQEKNLRSDLREKLNIDIDPEKVIHTSPRLESDGSL